MFQDCPYLLMISLILFAAFSRSSVLVTMRVLGFVNRVLPSLRLTIRDDDSPPLTSTDSMGSEPYSQVGVELTRDYVSTVPRMPNRETPDGKRAFILLREARNSSKA